MSVKVLIANKCGLCAGANKAIEDVFNALNNEKNVCLYHELVHNKNAMNSILSKGCRFCDSLEDIHNDEFVIIGAHGVSYSTFEYLNNKNIRYIDCTCPNVKYINKLVREKSIEGYKVLIIGKKAHTESLGSKGWSINNDALIIENEKDLNLIDFKDDKYYLVGQTTFAIDKYNYLLNLIKELMIKNNKQFDYKNTLCNAQREINRCALELSNNVDVMIIIGGRNSSNSIELFNNVKRNKEAYFVEDPSEINELLNNGTLKDNSIIGISAGASTLMSDVLLVKKIIEEYFNN